MTPRQKSSAASPRRSQGRLSSSSETAAARVPKMVLGDELEYRIARLQIFMGYFVRRGCPIYTTGMLNQATDLDLLAVRYVEPFRRQLLVTECKGGDDGPLDRIFWLSGVKTFVKADEAILVRKGTKWDIKDFAKRAGVGILDLHRISALELIYKIGEKEWPGISDRQFAASRLDDWNEHLGRSPNWWEFQITLATETSYDEPFAAVNYLLQQLRLITRTVKSSAPGALERKLIADGISQLCLFMLRISELSFDLSPEERKGFVEKGMRYGNLDPKLAERVLKSAYTLTRQAVLHYANKNIEIDEKLFQMPIPPGTPQILNIVENILNSYPVSLNLPQICDLVLGEVYLKGNRSGGWLRRIFPQTDLALRLDLLKRFLTLLVESGACPQEVLDSMALSDSEPTNDRRKVLHEQYAASAGSGETKDPTAAANAKSAGAVEDDKPGLGSQANTAQQDPDEFRLRPPRTPPNPTDKNS